MEFLTQEQKMIIVNMLPDAEMIYLFGSAARGELRRESDVDIAVYSPKKLDPMERFEKANKIANALGREVDLVDLRSSSSVFAFQVVSTGVVIKVQDISAKSEFEYLTYSNYTRLNEERVEILEAYGEQL